MLGAMKADPVRKPVPFDEQEMDRDLGVADVDPRVQHRVIQRAVIADEKVVEEVTIQLVRVVRKLWNSRALLALDEDEDQMEEPQSLEELPSITRPPGVLASSSTEFLGDYQHRHQQNFLGEHQFLGVSFGRRKRRQRTHE